jgi:NDP-sugar pyrophosphorylase family protein
MDYKILITTSGVGQRLGELTKYTNKSLVRVGKKPAISYIIESYPRDIPIVITLGYYGNLVKEFLSLAYPDRRIEYVEVDKYEGDGSSLGYSLLCAKNNLQCPFIYHACDTITDDKIPEPDHNWVGGYRGEESSQYATLNVSNKQLTAINKKGAMNYDYIHIGLVGIFNYANFWKLLEEIYSDNPNNFELNDCEVISGMLNRDEKFFLHEISSWLDIGNISSLESARKNVKDHFDNLEKIDESIFMFKDFVVKFFHNQDVIKKRVERAKRLKGLVPEIQGSTKNFYKYEYAEGELLSRVITPSNFLSFLHWAQEKLWIKKEAHSKEEFKKICFDFYHNKTKERVKKFLDLDLVKKQKQLFINDEKIPSVEDMLEQIDFDWLTECDQYNFHGDFILDNIIKTKDGYVLLDWRQDFGGQIEAGDMYYDLAKLNHNLTVNHDIINSNLFTIDVGDTNVRCDILRNNILIECQEVLHKFILDNNYDLKKVKLLSSIIWLNMSPLHHYPFNKFLFYFGKLNLWKTLKKS